MASYKDNKKELLGFLEREFPGRWVFEAEEAIAEGKDPESIVILWNQDKTEIVGYCMLSVDDKGYGGLGPIGIAKKSGKTCWRLYFKSVASTAAKNRCSPREY